MIKKEKSGIKVVMLYAITSLPELLWQESRGNKVSISDTYLSEIINMSGFVI